MEKIIIFDYGHGGEDGGATYKGRKEKDDVLKLGKDVKKVVERHGVQVDETRKGDETVSLNQRSVIANKKNYDFFISFHRNAFNGKAFGVETYTYILKKPKAVELATNINNGMVKVGFHNRGVKTANFKVLRDTKADAVLLEVGFIDNVNDNKIFDNKYNMLVLKIAKGILKTLGINYNEGSSGSEKVFYRVVTGSFTDKENADKRVEQLKMKGFDSFIDAYRG
jgi:N-acetylmuramoyl-L-alanine amidase